jgi:acyl transferase domain-containing protein
LRAALTSGAALETGGEPVYSGAAAPGDAARRWLAGEEVDWRELHTGEARRRVHLPTYPFERRRFWVDLALDGLADEGADAGLAAALDF